MNFDDMSRAVQQAKEQLDLTDRFVEKMANLVRGRLRRAGVSPWILKALKAELADFNATTGRWK